MDDPKIKIKRWERKLIVLFGHRVRGTSNGDEGCLDGDMLHIMCDLGGRTRESVVKLPNSGYPACDETVLFEHVAYAPYAISHERGENNE